jgi:hypothetical protein
MVYLAEIWCKTMHGSPMWPSHGHYECRTCGREYPVPWERDVTGALRRNNNEKPVSGRIRLAPVPVAQAAQMSRPS